MTDLELLIDKSLNDFYELKVKLLGTYGLDILDKVQFLETKITASKDFLVKGISFEQNERGSFTTVSLTKSEFLK